MTEGVVKRDANRDVPDYQKDRNRASPVAQSLDYQGADIESRIKTIEKNALHRQDYPARRSARLVVETLRHETRSRR